MCRLFCIRCNCLFFFNQWYSIAIHCIGIIVIESQFQLKFLFTMHFIFGYWCHVMTHASLKIYDAQKEKENKKRWKKLLAKHSSMMLWKNKCCSLHDLMLAALIFWLLSLKLAFSHERQSSHGRDEIRIERT